MEVSVGLWRQTNSITVLVVPVGAQPPTTVWRLLKNFRHIQFLFGLEPVVLAHGVEYGCQARAGGACLVIAAGQTTSLIWPTTVGAPGFADGCQVDVPTVKVKQFLDPE